MAEAAWTFSPLLQRLLCGRKGDACVDPEKRSHSSVSEAVQRLTIAPESLTIMILHVPSMRCRTMRLGADVGS